LFDHPFFYALRPKRGSSKDKVSIAEQVVNRSRTFLMPSFRAVYKSVNHVIYVRNFQPKRIVHTNTHESIPIMKVLAFVIVATMFEAVADAVMRMAPQNRYALPGRIALFALASVYSPCTGCF
jgi:hypothetical protein